jgi:uncharacterized protein YyaL (SSP411 family)
MCEDNARHALAFLDAWRLTGNALYADTVRGIFGFVLDTLSDPEGGAYGSQDADGEAEYYGNDLAGRAKMETPYIDRRFYTDWNGMMVAAALEASAVLDASGSAVPRPFDPAELRGWALRTVDRLTDRLWTDAGMRHVLRPGAGAHEVDEAAPLLLGDQAWWLEALLAAYQATGDAGYLRRATALARATEAELFDAARGACRDRRDAPPGDGAEGHLADPVWPLAENSALASALASLSALGGGDRWRERAAGILSALGAEADRHGLMGAGWALALARVRAQAVQVHLVGAVADPSLRALARAAWTRYVPGRVVEILDPALDGDRLAALGYPTADTPRAYVCIGDRCLAPVSAPAELDHQLASLTG